MLCSSFTSNRPSDTETVDGTNVVGPSLFTATYHSSLVNPTRVVPRSPSASDSVGGVTVVTTWRPGGLPGTS